MIERDIAEWAGADDALRRGDPRWLERAMARRPGANRRGLRGFGGGAPAAAAWDPSQITGVAEWWRADTGVTGAGGGAVSAWQGQIAGETVSQGTSTARPTLTTRDGQSVLSFDGGDVLRGSFATIGLLSQPVSWLLVVESTVTSTSVYCDGNNATNRVQLWQSGNLLSYFAGTIRSSASSASGAGEQVFAGVFNGPSSALYSNNLVTPISTLDPGANGIDGASFGANYIGSGMTGFIWEAVLVDAAISSADLAAFGAYAEARYPSLSLTY